MRQLLILSGKGGTGKTTVAASFIALADARAYADCDVDAPNLHLVGDLPAAARRRSLYLGLPKAVIDTEACTGCDICRTHCRFGAIMAAPVHRIESLSCEGCGLCARLCPSGAITLQPNPAGVLELFLDDRRAFSTASLNMGNGTSGRLVSAVKQQLKASAPADTDLAIVDGSPGIGCPVMSSMSGVDLILVVTEPTKSGLHDLTRLLDLAEKMRLGAVVCLNRTGLDPDWDLNTEAYCAGRGVDVVGSIPYDPLVVDAVNSGRPVVALDGPAARALRVAFDRTLASLMSPTPSGGTK